MSARYAGAMNAFYAYKDIYDIVILYEDLIADPTKVLKDMFNKMKVDLDAIPFAIEALKKDSQNNQGFLFKKRLYKFGPNEIEKVHEMFHTFKVGHLSFDMTLDDFRATLKLC